MCIFRICPVILQQDAKPENPESPVFVPLLRGPAYSLVPTGKGVQLRLGAAEP